MKKRKVGLFVGILVSVLAIATFLWAQSYATKVYMKQGGAEQVIASGGKQTVQSGGQVSLESGSALNAAGTATIAGITQSNLVDKSATETISGKWTLSKCLPAIDAHLLATTTGVYDLGSNSKQWKDLHLSGQGLVKNKVMMITLIAAANAIYSGTDTLADGTKAITFATAFKADTTPRIMLTNLTAANAMYASGVSNAGFTANGTTTDSFDFLAIGEAP